MATIRAFRPLRPATSDLASRIASVPYDVVTTEEARALAEGNPLSFLHVVRPEIDLPPGTDPYAEIVYRTGAARLEGLERERLLVADEANVLLLYRQSIGTHAQTGVVGCVSVDEYDADLIRKHEKTRKDKEDDRTRTVLAHSAHAEPVFLTYRALAEIDALVAHWAEGEPLYDFVAPDGVRHTVWRVPEPDPLVAAFRKVPLLYVADGHHRSASASRARAALRDRPGGLAPDAEANFFLATIFPGSQLRILAYNRVVADLGGNDEESFLAKVRERFALAEGAGPEPERKGDIRMFLGGRWWRLTVPARAFDPSDPVASLDVSVLQDRLLGPVLGIADPRTDKRIDFVGGIRGTGELEARVCAGKAAVAFSLFPVTVDDLMAIADSGKILPPKSTWFEPKLRSGLFVHKF